MASRVIIVGYILGVSLPSAQPKTTAPYLEVTRLNSYKKNYVPVRLLRPGNDGRNELAQWLEEATAGDPAEQLRIDRLITPYRNRVAQFNLPYLNLDVGTDKAVVLDVFVKMNTRSVPLSPFDIMVAQADAATGEDLHDHVASLNGQIPGIARYVDVSDLVLDAIALMQGYPPSKARYFDIDWKKPSKTGNYSSKERSVPSPFSNRSASPTEIGFRANLP